MVLLDDGWMWLTEAAQWRREGPAHDDVFAPDQQERGDPMQARVTTIQLQPGKIDEAIRLYQESVIPAAKQQPGFRSTMLITDRASGKGMAITVWASDAELQASEASGYYQEQLAKFGPFLAGSPVREVYEVSLTA
jgi:quinol monooxygenase YgiN